MGARQPQSPSHTHPLGVGKQEEAGGQALTGQRRPQSAGDRGETSPPAGPSLGQLPGLHGPERTFREHRPLGDRAEELASGDSLPPLFSFQVTEIVCAHCTDSDIPENDPLPVTLREVPELSSCAATCRCSAPATLSGHLAVSVHQGG